MEKPFIALQLYTVRDFTASDVTGTLRKVKEMGYDYVELAGTYGMDFVAFRGLLDEIGLKAISAHVMPDALKEDMAKTISDYKSLGCEYVIIPMIGEESLPGGDKCEKAFFEKFCVACGEAGVVPAYHNHAFEFKKLPCGTFILDKLFEDIPALQAELDTGWVRAAGQDPEAYITKYASRCPVVHLKDTIESGDGFEDRPVGKGSQDIPAIIQAANAAGAAGFVVELDNAVGITSLQAAEESLRYLNSGMSS
ncbi:MAG: sugar phosphate isomerase/epimerase [Defluviitaleaceae bacterium]|nr:sugar phosphate isomerase/epimerase [Defluviitaleaceae bacterium]